jgi:hypothetical protein
MSHPAERIRAIEGSLRCFTLGLLGLVPVLGLPAAFIALYLHGKVTNDAGEGWNPASTYANWGCALGWIGVAVTVALFGFTLLITLMNLN